MSDLDPFAAFPGDFDGRVRLFPLPELVLFPHALQPLHIFEPRYCEMLEEALATDQLITLATLCPGWHEPVTGQPAISPHVCIGHIATHAPTDDDRHNILLVGLQRARIIEEIGDTGRPFRSAHVELIEDYYPATGTQLRHDLKKKLLDAFRSFIPDVADMQKNLHALMASQMQLGTIVDIISFTLQLPTEAKLELLGEGNVDVRAKHLLQFLQLRADDQPPKQAGNTSQGPQFPPSFSEN